jgi:hypothetical protein
MMSLASCALAPYNARLRLNLRRLGDAGNIPMNLQELDRSARVPLPIKPDDFNLNAVLPFGLTIEHIRKSMADFIDFLGFINEQLYTKQIPRLEMIMMAANFSSLVGEFIIASVSKLALMPHCIR